MEMEPITIAVLVLVGLVILGVLLKFVKAAVKVIIAAVIFGGIGFFVYEMEGLAIGALIGCVAGLAAALK